MTIINNGYDCAYKICVRDLIFMFSETLNFMFIGLMSFGNPPNITGLASKIRLRNNSEQRAEVKYPQCKFVL